MNPEEDEIRTSFELDLVRAAKALRLGPMPEPWREAIIVPAAGAYACGWDEQEQFLMIGTSGYSLTVPDTGEQVARERDSRLTEKSLSSNDLVFSPPQGGSDIRLFGFEAGGGIRVTEDGWRLEVIYPWWPRASVILEQVFAPGYAYLRQAVLLDTRRLDGPLICGFSPSGRSIAILGSGGATLYSRQT